MLLLMLAGWLASLTVSPAPDNRRRAVLISPVSWNHPAVYRLLRYWRPTETRRCLVLESVADRGRVGGVMTEMGRGQPDGTVIVTSPPLPSAAAAASLPDWRMTKQQQPAIRS